MRYFSFKQHLIEMVRPTGTWIYYFNCTMVRGRQNGNDLKYMIDNSKEITYKTFLRYVSTDDWQSLYKSMGYAGTKKQGLTAWDDYATSFHSSIYQGHPVVYFLWSGIEHVFTKRGANITIY